MVACPGGRPGCHAPPPPEPPQESLAIDDLRIQRCPQCGSEFQPHILTCLDCGAKTVAAWDGEDAEPERQVEGPCPGLRTDGPEDATAFVFADDFDAIVTLQDRLRSGGIPSRLEIRKVGPEHGDRASLLVRPDDYVRARGLQLELYRRDAPEAVDLERQLDLEHCPFCGTKLAASRPIECPTCSLILGGGGDPEEDEEDRPEAPGLEDLRQPA